MNSHLRVILFVLCAVASVLLLAPLPNSDRNGAYNTISRLMWCKTESACLHEIGHRLDQEAGWVSHQKEFGEAAKTYMLVEFAGGHPSELAKRIINLPGAFTWDGYFGDRPAEIYATAFEYSGGHRDAMPEIFQEFYDWDRAETLVQKMRGEK
ncbi:MAG: hypothetical protein C4583_04405 [Anaerolineaceae bacterium]|nr:MAG: hypothetical protein C4583_04405 [Anaerolineaceae bacterium]